MEDGQYAIIPPRIDRQTDDMQSHYRYALVHHAVKTVDYFPASVKMAASVASHLHQHFAVMC